MRNLKFAGMLCCVSLAVVFLASCTKIPVKHNYVYNNVGVITKDFNIVAHIRETLDLKGKRANQEYYINTFVLGAVAKYEGDDFVNLRVLSKVKGDDFLPYADKVYYDTVFLDFLIIKYK
ncbi:hypothetical protein [Endomicrobium proavitum]|uniref:Lipoprotein n=1 Tax=Endomicrobium proavitum TaxID=1408281 RepID=A0A0G3WJL2_9BACT|nr:hypothetical protein [Endomicrobium proavitum]AKL98473.1 exported protein of unknown function [Endomicrobium proavitum]